MEARLVFVLVVAVRDLGCLCHERRSVHSSKVGGERIDSCSCFERRDGCVVGWGVMDTCLLLSSTAWKSLTGHVLDNLFPSLPTFNLIYLMYCGGKGLFGVLISFFHTDLFWHEWIIVWAA